MAKKWTRSNIKETRIGERGQAIVFMALMMVVLLASLGMAIDGGGIFLLYRNAQNAVDSGLWAGAYSICTRSQPEQVEQAIKSVIEKNGFVDGVDGSVVTVNYPPTQGEAANDDNFVEVRLQAEKPLYFIQIVWPGPFILEANGVSGCARDSNSIYSNNAIVATGTTCENQLRMSGSYINVKGGMFTNNDVQVNSADATISGKIGHVGDTDALSNSQAGQYWPHTTIAGFSGPGDMMKGLESISSPQPAPLLYNITDFQPGGKYAQQAADEGLYHYYGPNWNGHFNWAQTDVNNAQYLPKEGLIYVDGSFSASGGGEMVSGPKGLTIVATGKIQFSGPKVTLRTPYIQNLNLFSWEGFDKTNPNPTPEQLINGGTCSAHAIQWPSALGAINGLIYAPGGLVNVPTSGTKIYGQIVAYQIGTNNASFELEFLNPYLDVGPMKMFKAE